MSAQVALGLVDLVRRVAESRDREAFGKLFEHFAPRVKSWLMGGGSDASTADELAQETLLVVWHRANTYRDSRAAVSTWVFTMARNTRIDRLRRERRPTIDLDDPNLAPSNPPRSDWSWELLAGAQHRLEESISSLPEEQTLVLHKFYVEDKSHGAIARDLDLPVGTVKSRLRLAMQRLRGVYR